MGEERNRVNILYDVKSPNIVKGKIKHYSDKLKLKEMELQMKEMEISNMKTESSLIIQN